MPPLGRDVGGIYARSRRFQTAQPQAILALWLCPIGNATKRNWKERMSLWRTVVFARNHEDHAFLAAQTKAWPPQSVREGVVRVIDVDALNRGIDAPRVVGCIGGFNGQVFGAVLTCG